MIGDIDVVDRSRLSNSFLGDTTQVCVVTRDLYDKLSGFAQLGIGPWMIYDFSPENMTETTYRGAAEPYSMRVALATTGSSRWEVIQPLAGRTIYGDWLDQYGESVQHVVQRCDPLTYEEKIDHFRRRGFDIAQSGTMWGAVRFAYFDTVAHIGVAIEISVTPEGATFPAPDAWYPGPPS
jgi:hypothetical protein